MRTLLLLGSWLLAGLCHAGAAESVAPKALPEYTMKALYLYNFAQLTEWPTAGGQDRFNLCVVGQEDVAAALESLRGKSVAGRPLNPMRVETAADARKCDAIYVGEDSGDRSRWLLDLLRDSSVLTVTDDPRLAQAKPMLQIFQNGKRLAFDVDMTAARRGRLRFSSKLLQLANQVRD